MVRSDGSGLRRMFGGGAESVSWAPDSIHLAATLASGVAVVDASTGSSQIVSWAPHEWGAYGVTWSPR